MRHCTVSRRTPCDIALSGDGMTEVVEAAVLPVQLIADIDMRRCVSGNAQLKTQ